LKLLGFGGDLRCVELDLFWIFFGLDFDEPVDGLFCRFANSSSDLISLPFTFFTVRYARSS